MPTRYQRVAALPTNLGIVRNARTSAKKPASIATGLPASGGAVTASAATSARQMVDDFLAGQGLTGLGDAAWKRYLDLGGDSNPNAVDVIYQELRSNAAWTNNAYALRYPGMAALAKSGMAITEDQYRSMEDQYMQAAHDHGLPAGFYDDPADFGQLIAGHVSPTEYGQRLDMAEQYAQSDPESQALAAEFTRLYGPTMGQGAATAYFIDPEKSVVALGTQHRAAQAAAASSTVGFGSLSRDQAERISGFNLTYDQVAGDLSQVAALKPLETGLVGQDNQPTLTQDDLIAASVAQDANAKRKVQTVQDTRTAQFKGGGGFSSSQGGITGLGSAAG